MIPTASQGAAVHRTLGVHSEVGRLRQAVLHRPGPELSRLTPSTCRGLLFDDVPWAAKAREEHDTFAQVLRENEVVVHHADTLLAETLELPDARAFVLDRVCTPEQVGPTLVAPLRELFEKVDAAALAELLVGGVTRADLAPLGVHGLRWATLGPDDLVLAPLPNALYPRDSSAWIYGGVSISPMAEPARRREQLHCRAVHRFHPLFTAATFPVYLGDDDADHRPATLEGGDVHVLGGGVLLVGMGERTTPAAVEILARALFRAGQAHTVLAVQVPRHHARVHLDTVLAMVDVDTFVVHPGLDLRVARTWVLTAADPGAAAEHATAGLQVEERTDLVRTLSDCLGVPVRVLRADEDARAGQDEQRDDATGFLALAPGVVVGHERSTVTNSMLREHGIDVISLPGGELGRGAGGTRCLVLPLQRDGLR